MANKKQYKKLPNKKQKKGKGSVFALFASLTMLCLSILLALSLTVFFKTKSITIEGDTIYSDEQITAASGIEVGKNMFISMFGGASKRIETLLPYVGTAKINRNLDGNVVIKVWQNEVAYSFESNGQYLLADNNFKALELVSQRPEDKPLISGAKISDPQIGKEIKYLDKNAKQIIDEIFAAAGQNGLNVSAVSTDEDISFLDVTINNKYLVHLLSGNEIDYKILHIKKSIDSMAENEGGIFTFSESDTGKAVFKPCDINAPEQGEEEVPAPEGGEEENTSSDMTSSNVVEE